MSPPADEMTEEEEVAARSSAAATARPPDAFKELLPLMKDPSVVCLLGGAPLPSLFPIANITVTLTDGTSIQLDGAATHSAQRYAPFAQDDLLKFCRNQVWPTPTPTQTLAFYVSLTLARRGKGAVSSHFTYSKP